jgi:hypothetical protein
MTFVLAHPPSGSERGQGARFHGCLDDSHDP